MSKNELSNDLQLLKSTLLKVVNKIDGDEWSNSAIEDTKLLLNRIDKNPESHTQDNVNKELLDKSLNDFNLQLPIEKKEDTRNGAELIKDNVI